MTGEFSAGKVLGESFKIMFKHFATIFTITFVASLPATILTVHDALKEVEPKVEEEFTLESFQKEMRQGQLQTNVLLLCSSLCSGAVAFAVYQSLRGKSATIAAALGSMFVRFLPLVGVAICSTFLMGVGLVLLIIPGLIFATMVYVASPVCVVEKRGVFASMHRSRELTSGYRWRVFVVMVGVNLIMFVVALILGVGVGLSTDVPPAFVAALEVVVQLVQTAWNATAAALSYYHLRSIKESVDVEDVASMFD